jgi:hypothetical protein
LINITSVLTILKIYLNFLGFIVLIVGNYQNDYNPDCMLGPNLWFKLGYFLLTLTLISLFACDIREFVF